MRSILGFDFTPAGAGAGRTATPGPTSGGGGPDQQSGGASGYGRSDVVTYTFKANADGTKAYVDSAGARFDTLIALRAAHPNAVISYTDS